MVNTKGLADLELEEKSTSAIFALVQKEGNREVKREVKYYNLDAVISVGYRVNSDQFRRWATNVLKEFSKKWYIIHKKEWKMLPFLMKIILIYYLQRLGKLDFLKEDFIKK